jgi:hypothetical protein
MRLYVGIFRWMPLRVVAVNSVLLEAVNNLPAEAGSENLIVTCNS